MISLFGNESKFLSICWINLFLWFLLFRLYFPSNSFIINLFVYSFCHYKSYSFFFLVLILFYANSITFPNILSTFFTKIFNSTITVIMSLIYFMRFLSINIYTSLWSAPFTCFWMHFSYNLGSNSNRCSISCILFEIFIENISCWIFYGTFHYFIDLIPKFILIHFL